MLSLILVIVGAVWLGIWLVASEDTDVSDGVLCTMMYISFAALIWIPPFAGYLYSSSQFTISSIEITQVTPLEDGGVYQVGDRVIYLDGDDLYYHRVTSDMYSPLPQAYQVRHIENIHGEEMYELVEFDVPRGEWNRWWKYDDRWVVRRVRR